MSSKLFGHQKVLLECHLAQFVKSIATSLTFGRVWKGEIYKNSIPTKLTLKRLCQYYVCCLPQSIKLLLVMSNSHFKPQQKLSLTSDVPFRCEICAQGFPTFGCEICAKRFFTLCLKVEIWSIIHFLLFPFGFQFIHNPNAMYFCKPFGLNVSKLRCIFWKGVKFEENPSSHTSHLKG